MSTTGVLPQVQDGPVDPDRILRVDRLDGRVEISLGELHRRAGRAAGWLYRRGIRQRDLIGVVAANGTDWVLADLAALRLGAVVAGLEPGKFDADPDLSGRYGLSLLLADRGVAGAVGLDEMRGAAADPSWPAPDPVRFGPREPTTLKFTSGSTGVPKAVAASAGSVEQSMSAVQQMFAHGPGDDLFVFLPLSLLQQRYWVYSAFAFGHDVTISTYEAAFAAMRRVRPTVVMGVPAFYDTARRHIVTRAARAVGNDLGAIPDADRTEALRGAARRLFGDRVRYLWTGSAPAAPAILEFFDRCDMPIYEGYGLNETCIVAKNHPRAHRVGSVGQVLPGKRVTVGEDGVLTVHSDYPVAEGYTYAEPGATERMFGPGGAVRTGDLGHLDEDGFLFVHGRADDVLVLENGRKIVARTIEDRLRAHPAVHECVLFCPDQTALVAVVSPAGAAGEASVADALAAANGDLRVDERISRAVLARPAFSIDNELLTSQYKPRRLHIYERYRDQIHDRDGGVHAPR